MIPSEEETAFIEQFNQENYQPELLFEDAEILGRIEEHPMAAWRTRRL
jgi:hypothetical protein